MKDADTTVDLLVAGGEVFDSVAGVFYRADIAIHGGVFKWIGSKAASPNLQTLDASGMLVVPGLVDLHTHLYWGVSHYGVRADDHCVARGVTTAIDAGSSGSQTFPGFKSYVIDQSHTRIHAFINISSTGMISPVVGELENIQLVSVADTVAAARNFPDVIVGVKLRLGLHRGVGVDPMPALRLARRAADEIGKPMMVHISDMEIPIESLLEWLGAGDIITHAFTGRAGGVVDDALRVKPEVFEAQARGVVFDIGHGQNSFAFRVGHAAAHQGFLPDTISSDIHAHNVNGPAFDQVTTLTKLLHLGMTIEEVLMASTLRPAKVVSIAESVGQIADKRPADLTLLRVIDSEVLLTDGMGKTEEAGASIEPAIAIVGGQIFECER